MAVATEYLLLLVNTVFLIVQIIKESRLQKKIKDKLKQLKEINDKGKTKLQKVLEEKSKFPFVYSKFHPNMIRES